MNARVDPQQIKLPVQQAPRCLIDFETRSECDLKACGATVYAEDPSTQILCMSFSFDDEVVELWTPWEEGYEEYQVEKTVGRGKNKTAVVETVREPCMVYRPEKHPFPQKVIDHVLADGTIEAHSANMERSVWRAILMKQFGVPACTRWVDTQATCAYRGIPLSLDAAGHAMNVDILKDTAGKDILRKISKPRKATKKDQRKWNNQPELFQQCFNYCIRDNEAERALGKKIGELPDTEYRIWVLDQVINTRGVKIDVASVRATQKLAEKVTANLNAELRELTEGEIDTGGQHAEIAKWLEVKHKILMPDMTASRIKDTLKDKGIPQFEKGKPETYPRRVLEIRREISRTSTKKLESMLNCLSSDGRIHGLLQYHGSQTGRWAGRLTQPQNFPRPKVNGKPFKGDMEALINMLLWSEPDLIRAFYGPEMETIAASLRGMFVASDGCKYVVVDFASIEARIVLWLAGQMDAMDIFRKADAKLGPDIYCYLATDLYGRPITKKDEDERQLGKIGVLGCGYQMSAPRLLEQAHDDYELDLPIETCEKIVTTYRTTFSDVPIFWREINNTACSAVETGQPQEHRGIIYEVVHDNAGKWLSCRLHNGKRIWYYNPSVTYEPAPAAVVKKYPKMAGKLFPKLWYEGRDNKRGGLWTTISSYGGMLTENIVQAIAREIMKEAMVRAEQAGYKLVLTVHDELVCEVPKDFGSHKELERIAAQEIPWCPGLPVAAEGWEGPRYKKA